MIKVEFRLTTGGGGKYRVIYKDTWPTTPSLGELVNLNGDPYIVHQRGWAACNDRGDGYLYCYLDVSPYQYGQRCSSIE